MRKLFFVLVAIFLMATSAYAWVETADNGPEQITTCYAIHTQGMTSGNVVILQTSSPTYPGKEVTGTTTDGQRIYGVVVDNTTYTATEMEAGRWIRVQVHGYCPIIKITNASGNRQTTAGQGLYTSTTSLRAAAAGAGLVTGNVTSFTTSTGTSNGTVAGFIGG